MQRKKPIRRKSKKGSNRERARKAGHHAAYLSSNPQCEFEGCFSRHVVLEHIVQVSGSTYEWFPDSCLPPGQFWNYFASCPRCHDKKHADNLRYVQVKIKQDKGEWPIDEVFRVTGANHHHGKKT